MNLEIQFVDEEEDILIKEFKHFIKDLKHMNKPDSDPDWSPKLSRQKCPKRIVLTKKKQQTLEKLRGKRELGTSSDSKSE